MGRPFIALLSLAVVSCSQPSVCGSGTASTIGDARVCSFRADVVIVTGFDCPPGFSVRMDGAHGTLCADAWVDPAAPEVCGSIGCDGVRLHVPAPRPGCEGLDPTHCLAPWPSDTYLGASGTLSIPGAALPTDRGEPLDTSAWSRSDGFAPTTPIAVVVGGPVDPAPLPGEDRIEASTTASSPTVVLDVSTAPPRRVPHVAELDAWGPGTRTTLWIRPLSLDPGHRIVVAVRDLARPDGTRVAPPLPFRALRDGVATDAPWLEARRATFERDVLGPLADAGVDRASLYLAWTFHVATAATVGRDVVAMRAALDAVTPACTVSSSTTAGDGTLTVRGWFVSPRFLSSRGSASGFARAPDGAPAPQGDEPFPFVVAVPASVVAARVPTRALLLGHVLGGSAEAVVTRPEWLRFAADRGAVLVATDLAGATATDTSALLASLPADPSAAARAADRALQGAADVAALARALATCAGDARLAPYLDASSVHVVGLEWAGALLPALDALGAPVDGFASVGPPGSFASWARRSSAALPLDDALRGAYGDATDRALLVAALETPWQSLDAASRLESRRVLELSAVDSTRAPPFLARAWAASFDVPLLLPSVEAASVTPTVGAPAARAWIAFDAGYARTLPGSVRPTLDRPVESALVYTRPAADLLDGYLRTGGAVASTCGGPCAL